MHSCLSMNLFATFAFLLPGHPTLSTTFDNLKQRKKTAEKIDTNAQWFHCSWSILLKRVNIRVRGFHLVYIHRCEGSWKEGKITKFHPLNGWIFKLLGGDIGDGNPGGIQHVRNGAVMGPRTAGYTGFIYWLVSYTLIYNWGLSWVQIIQRMVEYLI